LRAGHHGERPLDGNEPEPRTALLDAGDMNQAQAELAGREEPGVAPACALGAEVSGTPRPGERDAVRAVNRDRQVEAAVLLEYLRGGVEQPAYGLGRGLVASGRPADVAGELQARGGGAELACHRLEGAADLALDPLARRGVVGAEDGARDQGAANQHQTHSRQAGYGDPQEEPSHAFIL
jgi:hypothetical protein